MLTRRQGELVLAGVAVAYVAAQLLLVAVDRFWAWDEAVYVSQVSRVAPPAFFGAHRARGITLLVWPVISLTESVVAVRVSLAVLAGVALFLAYRPWLRVLDPVVAPLAALLFTLSWLPLYYGTEVSPNLWVAFGAVAAGGFTAQALWGAASRWTLPAAAAAIAGAALMRPADAVWLAFPLVVAALLAARARWRSAAILVAGLAAGWLPWVLEAVAQFGGPIRRLRIASASARMDTFGNLAAHLRMTDGALACCFGRFREDWVPAEAVLWWLGFAVFAALGVAATRGATRRTASLAAAAAVALAVTYLFLTQFVYARFLLPSYGLAAVAAAVGVVAAVRGPSGRAWALYRVAVLAALSLALSALAVWHLGVLGEVIDKDARGRGAAVAVAGHARTAGVRPPCFVVGIRAPSIAYALRCRAPGINRAASMRNVEAIRARMALGEDVAAFWRFELPAGSFAAAWDATPLKRVGQRGWTMYRPPPGW